VALIILESHFCLCGNQGSRPIYLISAKQQQPLVPAAGLKWHVCKMELLALKQEETFFFGGGEGP
jgi:hypothetical protein